MRQSAIPEKYRDYPCEDYFAKGWSARGYFDEEAQLLLVAPLPEAYLDDSIEFFAIGRSGCDGIDFGYRKSHAGLWAYYPIDGEFKYMAATVAQLVDDFISGRVSV